MNAASRPLPLIAVDQDLLRAWPLPSVAHTRSKEDRGRVLVIAGSADVPGAALLSGIAALRAGAGKLQVATVESAALPLALRLPEAKVIGVPADASGEVRHLPPELVQSAARCDAIVLGPGMSQSAAMQASIEAICRHCQVPVVLDAGALAASAFARPGQAVLTPHAGEMAGMVGLEIEQVREGAVRLAQRHARETGSVVVLKGSTTFIASPDGRTWINEHGSPGLGTSGSGDVLAGLLGGLLARGATREQAACWAVYLHAAAGERLQQRMGAVGFLAREIAAEVPAIMHLLAD